MNQDRHVYETDIDAEPAAVWRALTDSAWTRRWFHATTFDAPPQAGRPYRTLLPDGALATEGVVEELVPPAEGRPGRLVQTWGVRWDAELAAEPAGRLEWTVSAAGPGRSRVRLVHSGLGGSPRTSAEVGDGWTAVLDGLRAVLERESAPVDA